MKLSDQQCCEDVLELSKSMIKMSQFTMSVLFLKEVLRVREFQERKEWGMWNRAHATLPGASPTKGSVTRMQAGTALAQEMGRGFMNPKVCSGAGREAHCAGQVVTVDSLRRTH